MTAIRQVDRLRARDCLQRAEECRNAMAQAFERGEFNACAINAVHAGISAADALCVFTKGVRHASQRHEEAVALFLDIGPHDEEIKNSVKHLQSLLRIKTDAEYGEKMMGKGEAELCMKHAERLLSFVAPRIRKEG